MAGAGGERREGGRPLHPDRSRSCRASDHRDRVPGAAPEVDRDPGAARSPHEGAARRVEQPCDERQPLGRP
jgi:hypothetical protein